MRVVALVVVWSERVRLRWSDRRAILRFEKGSWMVHLLPFFFLACSLAASL